MRLQHEKHYRRLLMDEFGLDANETAFVFPELQAVQAENVRVEYARTVARQLLPVDHSIPAWAETWAYYEVDERSGGGATIITHMTDELPEVGLNRTKVVHGLHRLGKAYSYSIDDVLAAVRGFSLPLEKGAAARRAIERDIDEIAAVGHASAGLQGFTNHTAIPLTASPGPAWSGATAAQILTDVYTAITTVREDSKDLHRCTDLVVPLSHMVILETTAVDTTNQRKLIDIIRDTFPGLTVTPWTKLETAGAGATPRLIAFEKSMENVKLVISQEYQEEPPEKRNLGFVVPCHAKMGGVAVIRPLSATYMDLA